MKRSLVITVITFAACALLGTSSAVFAQAAPAAAPAASKLPADPWPRDLSITSAAVLVYQPQVNKWEGNQIDFRTAVAIKPTGAKDETFGVIFATARTQVDKVARTVVFENLKITKTDFPSLPDHGAAYGADLQKRFASDLKTISLDRLNASLALAGIKPPTVAVQNNPPQVLVSYSPAILVPIDGAPVMKPAPNSSRFQRVINTRALILQGGFGNNFYIHVYDGWLSASSLAGPWSQVFMGPLELNDANAIAQQLSKDGTVDLLDGGPKANPKPTLANGVPTIYTTQAPTELIVFKGQPDFVPIVGTQLLWASNTTSDVLINTANNDYYALLAGRWFKSGALTGPWTFVPERCAATRFREDSAAVAGRRRAAHGRGHAAGAGSRDRELDPANRHGAAQERAERSRPISTARRSMRRSPARRFRTSSTRRSRSFASTPARITRSPRACGSARRN